MFEERKRLARCDSFACSVGDPTASAEDEAGAKPHGLLVRLD